MFCTNCGAQLPQDSRFCFKCGAPVPSIAPAEPAAPEAPADAWPGWKAEIAAGEIQDLRTEHIPIFLMLVENGDQPFFTLTPPQLVEGSRYMQACSDDAGKLHLELCMARGSVGFEMFGINGISAGQAAPLFLAYLQQQVVPVPLDGFKWELI